MRLFVMICWGLTAAAAALGLIGYVQALNDATSAPQQAAAAAMAVAGVVIPYVFTRAMEGLASKPAPAPTNTKEPAKQLALGEGQY